MLFVMISSHTLPGKYKRRTHDVTRKAVQDSDILVYRSIVGISRMLFITPIQSHKYILLRQPRLFYYLLVTFHPPNTYITKDLIDSRVILVYILKGSIPPTKSVAKEVENEKDHSDAPQDRIWRTYAPVIHTDIRGLLYHLVLQKTACGDAAFATASQVTGRRPHHTSAPDRF